MIMLGFAVLVKIWMQHWNSTLTEKYNYLHVYIINGYLKDYCQNLLPLWNEYEWINFYFAQICFIIEANFGNNSLYG